MSYEHDLAYPRSSLTHQPKGILSSDCSTSYQNYQATLESFNTPFHQQQQLLPGQQENMHPLGYSGWTAEQQAQQVAQPNTINYNCRNQQQEVFSGQQEMVPIGNAPWAEDQQINPNEHFRAVIAEQRNNYQNQFPGQQENMDPLGYSGWTGQQQNYSNQLGSSVNYGQQPQQYIDMNHQSTGGFAGYNDHVVQQQPSLVHNNQQMNQYSDGNCMQNSSVQNVTKYGMPQKHGDADEEKYSPFGDLKNLSAYEWQRNQRRKLFDISRPLFTPSSVDISLANRATWLKYHKHGNEMMVINSGRILFPYIGFTFASMNPNAEYVVGIKLLQSEEQFEYKDGDWVASEKAKTTEKETNEVYSIPKSGAELMEKGLVFDRLKIYNIGQDSKKGRNSMANMSQERRREAEKKEKKKAREMLRVIARHHYIPVVTVFEVAPTGVMIEVKNNCFEETAFMVVTDYKNPIIKAKKGFGNKWSRDDVKQKHRNGAVLDEEEESRRPVAPTHPSPSVPLAAGPHDSPLDCMTGEEGEDELDAQIFAHYFTPN